MPPIDKHLSSPEISIDAHIKNVRIGLGEQLAQRHAIYLDTNFWIMVREAAAGRGSSTAIELRRLLRDGVTNGLLFCPISETTFFEVIKQRDPVTRRATVAMIDELSLGATLIGQQERVAVEISHLFHDKTGRVELHPLNHLVWSKLNFVMGEYYPANTVFGPITETAIQKAFFDHMWARPLTDLTDHIDGELHPEDDLGQLTDDLNAGISENAHQLRSFNHAYNTEVRGLSDLVGGMALDAVAMMARREGIVPNQSVGNDPAVANQYKALIAAALIQGKARKALGTMNVMATLHASLRWNKGRKVKANDLPDFDHAAAALVYCDAFFTERSLATMVKQNHVALDRFHECFVTEDPEQAVDWTKTLLSPG